VRTSNWFSTNARSAIACASSAFHVM
jgi:hypothetical protein